MATGFNIGAAERTSFRLGCAPASTRLLRRLSRGRPSTLPASDLAAIARPTTVTVLASDALDDVSEAPQASFSARKIDEELELLLQLLPPAVRAVLKEVPDVDQLVEVVLDLGRPPSARFAHGDVQLSPRPLTAEDLDKAVAQVGLFDGDNRAGIDSTLHRISAIRNRAGRVVGLTCRAGRTVAGAAELVRDLVLQGRSVLLLGRPGVGKTTALREVCRIAADEARRRVVIVDTSNEIGGDGDVPHPSIGGARRMQVPRPEAQHAVMVEAVENHMPQVVVIDEISTLAECSAARTIAQRGVQLVATAHGNRLENVIKNPTLADLVGGIQSVTLGDEEARRRGVQKSILERAAPPTFDVAVEMEERGRWRVHLDVAAAVDTILAGGEASGQVRFLDGSGQVTRASYMGTVRRTDESGSVSTSEWWADEAGGEEPLLWPARADTRPPPPTLPMPASASASSSSSRSTSAAGPGRTRLPGGGGGGGGRNAATASAAAAVSPLSTALRSVCDNRGSSSGGGGAAAAGGQARAVKSAPAPAPSPGAAGSTVGSKAAAAAPAGPMRAYLVMDEAAAARVRAVLGLLRREAYNAAVAAAAASSSSGGSGSSSSGSGGTGAGPAAAAAAGAGAGSLIEIVPDLEMADVVISTKSRLRNTPKIKNSAKKRELPIYALTATSTSALLRNLCPLLGLDPLAVAEVVRAAGAVSASASGSWSSEDDEEGGEGEEGEAEEGQAAGLVAGSPSGPASGAGGGGGHKRTLDLSAADDYAELLATTVRELRYAPLDRSYAQHVLGRFIQEMTELPPPPAAGGSAAAAAAAAAAPGYLVRASSLAAVAWSCSFVKHRKKFVEASQRELGLLAAACGQRWPEFSGQDLLRLATGFAGLRLAPPSAEWLAGLTEAAAAVLGSQAKGEGSGGDRQGKAEADGKGSQVLSADEASRLQLALAELDVLLAGSA